MGFGPNGNGEVLWRLVASHQAITESRGLHAMTRTVGEERGRGRAGNYSSESPKPFPATQRVGWNENATETLTGATRTVGIYEELRTFPLFPESCREQVPPRV